MVHIQVVGSGCPTCEKLEAMCREVVDENSIDAKIEKVTDINTFSDLGIFLTPGLLINGTIVSSGKLPTKLDIEKWIKKEKTNI
jgi:small redox-active disulfide protein 2